MSKRKPAVDFNTPEGRALRARFGQYELYPYWLDEELCPTWDWINLMWNVTGHHNTTFVLALEFCSGLRRKELISLAVEDCHPASGYIHVANGKGGKARDVELIPEFLPKFRDRIAQLKAMDHKYVFQHWRWKQPLGIRRANKLWNEAREAAGLRPYWIDQEAGNKVKAMGIHAGRKTFSTHALKLWYLDSHGKPYHMELKDLKAELGHAKLKTTLDVYSMSMLGHRFNRRELEWVKHI